MKTEKRRSHIRPYSRHLVNFCEYSPYLKHINHENSYYCPMSLKSAKNRGKLKFAAFHSQIILSGISFNSKSKMRYV